MLEYLAIVARRWIWVLVALVVMVSASAGWTVSRPQVFHASARVLLAGSAAQRALDPRSQGGGLLSRDLSNEIALAQGDEVEQMVEGELGLLPAIDVTADAEADVLIFEATAGTGAEAAPLRQPPGPPSTSG